MTERASSNGDIQAPGPTPPTIEEKLTAATADTQNGILNLPSSTAGSTADRSKSKAPTIPLDEASTSEPRENEEEQYSIFPSTTRIYLSYLLGFVMTLSTLTATIYFPLIPMLSDAFAVSIQGINLTVTVYAIFQAVAPWFFASLADTTGRRLVLFGFVALYAAASLGLALNRNSYAVLMALRAVQSIGGSPIPAIGYGRSRVFQGAVGVNFYFVQVFPPQKMGRHFPEANKVFGQGRMTDPFCSASLKRDGLDQTTRSKINLVQRHLRCGQYLAS